MNDSVRYINIYSDIIYRILWMMRKSIFLEIFQLIYLIPHILNIKKFNGIIIIPNQSIFVMQLAVPFPSRMADQPCAFKILNDLSNKITAPLIQTAYITISPRDHITGGRCYCAKRGAGSLGSTRGPGNTGLLHSGMLQIKPL